MVPIFLVHPVNFLSYDNKKTTTTTTIIIICTLAISYKWVPYSERYLFNAKPDTNHIMLTLLTPTVKSGNPNPTNPTTKYRCE